MKAVKIILIALGVLLVAALIAPYIAADQYTERLKVSLERALGRRIELNAKPRFSLLHGPAFRVDGGERSGVVIHEDPAIGVEPIAYVGAMEIRPSIWKLLTGKFVIASIRLEDASINLSKSGPASESGRWNFASVVNPSVMRVLPALQIRNGRINFKFGDDKSRFYLTETDLDISPPVSIARGWKVDCSAQLARTDRPSSGLGAIRLYGRWFVQPERVDLNFDLGDTGLDELTTLVRGEPGGIHGAVTSHLHLAGPVNGIGIAGRLRIDDVHRWDLLPHNNSGLPLDIRGQLNLTGQQIYLESNSTRDVPLPLWVRFRASNYLSQPHWGVNVNWNHFPTQPLMQLAQDMGATFPPRLQLGGMVDGAIGYSGEGSFQGALGFHGASLTIPDSAPVRFEDAYLVMDHGHVRLSPASVLSATGERAQIEADYAIDAEALDLSIVSDSMKTESLRSQVALAAVPWLEHLQSGEWKGQLHYHRDPRKSDWSGDLQVADAKIAVAGLADPLILAETHARIDGARLTLDHIQAQAGKLAFTGEYQYEPDAPHPHRVRLRAAHLDAADLEAEFQPTLRRESNLIARALGRSNVPDWLRQRGVEGTIAVDKFDVSQARLENVKTHMLWDVSRVDLDNLQATFEHAPMTGQLAVNLRGARPAYKLTFHMKGWDSQSGRLDVQGAAETSGVGAQLLPNLTADGTLSGAVLDFGTTLPWRCVSGTFRVAWMGAAPKLFLAALNLRNGDDSYIGQGGTQDGGRLLLTLTNGPKEVRVSGAPGALKAEDAAR